MPYLKSVDISKKAHNDAANLLSMEHFVLKGYFTTRVFSSCQITGILKTPFLKSVSIAQTGFKKEGRFSNISLVKHCLGPFQSVVQEWCCYSAFDGIIPWAHACASLILLWFS